MLPLSEEASATASYLADQRRASLTYHALRVMRSLVGASPSVRATIFSNNALMRVLRKVVFTSVIKVNAIFAKGVPLLPVAPVPPLFPMAALDQKTNAERQQLHAQHVQRQNHQLQRSVISVENAHRTALQTKLMCEILVEYCRTRPTDTDYLFALTSVLTMTPTTVRLEQALYPLCAFTVYRLLSISYEYCLSPYNPPLPCLHTTQYTHLLMTIRLTPVTQLHLHLGVFHQRTTTAV